METLKNLLLTWGIPGLFFITLLDSAGVPLPGGPDAVVMLLSWQRPNLMVFIALAATLGSTVGNWLLYQVGRKGGGAALARFDQKKRDWVTDKLKRNDFLAILIAMLGPPPFPTKIFILMAGAFEMRMRRFLLAVFGGRLVRYFGEAYLGARFGDEAAEILANHYGMIALALVAVVLGFLLARHFWSRRQAPAPTP